MMEKVGIIKAISHKPNGKNCSFCLTEGTDWYNGYESAFVGFVQGDKITFSFDKESPYKNFTDVVKMPSDGFVQGNDVPQAKQIYDKYAQKPTTGLLSVKDVQITSQCMMKCMFYNKTPAEPDEVYEAYQYFVKKLEENG